METTFLPQRGAQKEAFLLAVDHCFNIKGQGTVLTGTVLNGEVKVNDVIINSRTNSEFYLNN